MSKGSPIVPIRIPPLLLAEIDRLLKSANKNRKEAPYTRTSWILYAVTAKIDHIKRSNKKKRKEDSGNG